MPKDKEKPPSPPAPTVRHRAAISMERRLALLLISIIAAADAKDQRTLASQLEAARQVTKEVNDKVLKPTLARLKEIEGEIAIAVKDVTKIDPTVIGALAREQIRLQGKIKTLQGQSAT